MNNKSTEKYYYNKIFIVGLITYLILKDLQTHAFWPNPVFFKNASYHLKPNGLFGFDFWYTDAVNAQKPKIRLLELRNKDFKVIRLAEPSKGNLKNTINVDYTVILKNMKKNLVNVIKENHKMKHFSLTELSSLYKKYRFKCLHVGELVSDNKPSKNTWGVFCLLKKY